MKRTKQSLTILSLLILSGGIAVETMPAATIDVLVGDKNGFGFSPACPDTGNCSALNNPSLDNRTPAEMIATDGSQFTDVYSSLYSGAGPNTVNAGDVFFPFSGALTSATLSFAAGDFQAGVFGPLAASINGVSIPFSYADGRFATVIHSITLTPAEPAAAKSRRSG